MKKFFNTYLGFTILLAFISCSSNSTESEESTDYMSLAVGDIREYFDTGIEEYQTWEIKGKIKRSDGLDVFVGEWSSSIDTFTWSSYYAISDNYFISTELEKTNNSENPYHEQRLAKINPKDGDRWVHTLGVADSEKVYFSAKYIGNHSTLAEEFKDVFVFTLSDVLTIYDAKYYGNVGNSSPLDNTFTISLNYAKISGKEIGNYVSFNQQKQLSKKKANYYRRKVNFLGQFID